jgi:hypothetical protein
MLLYDKGQRQEIYDMTWGTPWEEAELALSPSSAIFGVPT